MKKDNYTNTTHDNMHFVYDIVIMMLGPDFHRVWTRRSFGHFLYVVFVWVATAPWICCTCCGLMKKKPDDAWCCNLRVFKSHLRFQVVSQFTKNVGLEGEKSTYKCKYIYIHTHLHIYIYMCVSNCVKKSCHKS